MAITLSCRFRERSLRVAELLAGKLIRCPNCEAPNRVPAEDVDVVEVIEEGPCGPAATYRLEADDRPPRRHRASCSVPT